MNLGTVEHPEVCGFNETERWALLESHPWRKSIPSLWQPITSTYYQLVVAASQYYTRWVARHSLLLFCNLPKITCKSGWMMLVCMIRIHFWRLICLSNWIEAERTSHWSCMSYVRGDFLLFWAFYCILFRHIPWQIIHVTSCPWCISTQIFIQTCFYFLRRWFHLYINTITTSSL
jgi:hypothetical protein